MYIHCLLFWSFHLTLHCFHLFFGNVFWYLVCSMSLLRNSKASSARTALNWHPISSLWKYWIALSSFFSVPIPFLYMLPTWAKALGISVFPSVHSLKSLKDCSWSGSKMPSTPVKKAFARLYLAQGWPCRADSAISCNALRGSRSMTPSRPCCSTKPQWCWKSDPLFCFFFYLFKRILFSFLFACYVEFLRRTFPSSRLVQPWS